MCRWERNPGEHFTGIFRTANRVTALLGRNAVIQNRNNDLRIPLLSEYISICKKYGKVCVLEVKNHFSEDALSRMVKEIAALDYLDRVTFISFDWENCVNLRRMLPTQQIQWLTSGAIDDEVIQKLVDNHLDLDVHYYQLNREVLSKLHAAGITVNCWTCDSSERAAELIEMGVDQITTNILE